MIMALSVSVSALSLPMVITGKIINEGSVRDIKVMLVNVRTNGQATYYTESNGFFQFEPQNMEFGVQYGDKFLLKTEGMEFDVEFDYDTYAPFWIEIDFTGEVCPKCPEPKECPKCPECPEDTTPYANCDSCCESCCEECPTIEEQLPYFCPEIDDLCQTEFQEKCELTCDCPVPEPIEAIGMLITLLGGLGVGAGAVYLKLSKTARHFHYGIKNYHSIYTSHRDPLEKHPRGEIAPLYKKDSKGKWVYVPKDDR